MEFEGLHIDPCGGWSPLGSAHLLPGAPHPVKGEWTEPVSLRPLQRASARLPPGGPLSSFPTDDTALIHLENVKNVSDFTASLRMSLIVGFYYLRWSLISSCCLRCCILLFGKLVDRYITRKSSFCSLNESTLFSTCWVLPAIHCCAVSCITLFCSLICERSSFPFRLLSLVFWKFSY